MSGTASAQRSRVARQSMLINFRLTVQCSTGLLKSAHRAVFVYFVFDMKGQSCNLIIPLKQLIVYQISLTRLLYYECKLYVQ